MLLYKTGIEPPKSADNFEQLCLIVYGEAFGDPTASPVGRSGQKQDGVDVFVTRDGRRIGVQCKRVTYGKLTEKIINAEVAKADAGTVELDELVVATTAPSNAKLVQYVARLTDERKAAGKFKVSVAFWDEIEAHIAASPRLQYQFAPQMPGGAYYKHDQQLDAVNAGMQVLQAMQAEMASKMQELATSVDARQLMPTSSALEPSPRVDSLNKFVDGQLDVVKRLITLGRFAEAFGRLGEVGDGLDGFDKHQRARWQTQRAQCYWHLGEPGLAAGAFAQAYDLDPDDPKIAGNAVRGLMLADRVSDALALGGDLKTRFPMSTGVYTAWANARHRLGLPLEWADVPLDFRETHELRFVFGWFAVLDGRFDVAIEHAGKACESPDADFSSKALLLLALVSKATEDAVLASVGIISPALRLALKDATVPFEPVDERLWTYQDANTVCDVASCLGYAYLLTGREQTASDFMRDAVQRYPDNAQMYRICLEALMKAEGEDAAYAFGRAHVAQLDKTGRLVVAEVAGRRGDVSVVEEVRAMLGDDASEHEDEMRAFRLLAHANSGQVDVVVPEIQPDRLKSESSIALLGIAATVLQRVDVEAGEEVATRLLGLIDSESTLSEVMVAAQVCRVFEWLDDVIRLLESRLPKGHFSELHKRLFEACVQNGSRRKALNLLRSFPAEALDDLTVRSLAVQLAQSANDWTELSRLAALQLAAYPERADAKVFRAVVLLRQSRITELRQLLEQPAPLTLEGDVRVRAQLSRLELEYGQPVRGWLRLYSVLRGAPGDPQAAMVFFSNLVGLRESELPENPTAVAPGVEVRLADSAGATRYVVIDPAGLPTMPPLASHVSAESDLAARLEGRVVGDEVAIEDQLGGVHVYTVIRVGPAHRALAELARSLIPTAVAQEGAGMLSIEISLDADGNPDMSNVVEMLGERRQQTEDAFRAYEQTLMTLGMLAQALGANTVDLVNQWPQSDAPKLYVSDGTAEELAHARTLLDGPSRAYVTDLATVNEFFGNGAEAALQVCQPLHIATSALDAIEDLIALGENDRSVAQAYEQHGKVVIVNADDDSRAQRVAYLRQLRDTVLKYCIPSPVYGAEEIPRELVGLRRVLDDVSQDSILLALEKSAVLLTVDGKLRILARVAATVESVWPQVVIEHAAQRDALSCGDYSRFAIRNLLSRRTHVRLGGPEVMWLLQQPSQLQDLGVSAVLRQLGNVSNDVQTCFSIVIGVVEQTISDGIMDDALFNLVEVLLAPLFTRADCSPDTVHTLAYLYLSRHVKRVLRSPFISDVARKRSNKETEFWLDRISEAIKQGRASAQSMTYEELVGRTTSVQLRYPMRVPVIMLRARHDSAVTAPSLTSEAAFRNSVEGAESDGTSQEVNVA